MVQKRKTIALECLMIALGMIGTIGCFLSTFPFQIPTPIFALGMLLSGIYLYVAYCSEKRIPLLKYGAIAYLGVAIVTFPSWRNGILAVLNIILRVYESNSQFSFRQFSLIDAGNLELPTMLALWLLFIPVCLVIIRTIRCKHSYFLAFFASAPFLFAILLFTLRPHPIFFTILLVFYLMLFGMAFGGHYEIYRTSSSILKCGLCFGLAGGLLMAGIRVIKPEGTYIRNQFVENLRVSIQVTIKNLIQGNFGDSKAGELDLASAGNRYYINSNDIKVSMNEPRSMYLHGFSASIYEDNHWKTPDNDAFLALFDWRKDGLIHPFNLLHTNYRNSTGVPHDYQIVQVENLEANPAYVYAPYNSAEYFTSQYVIHQDSYIQSSSRKNNQFEVLATDVVEQLTPVPEAEIYLQKLRQLNLVVPRELQEILSSISIPGMSNNLAQEEKVALIQSYLRSFGTYTLSPGTTPRDEDFVGYFLSENRQGYCVHYASAAVMLMRYHGVPARYASGYYISETSFQEGVGYAKDQDEHAWAEVFDARVGWKPVEVTPSSSASIEDPIMDPNRPVQNQPQITPDPNNPTDQPQPQTPNDGLGDTEDANQHFLSIDLAYLPYVIFIALLLILLPLRRWWMHQKWQKAFRKKDPRLVILTGGDYLTAWNIESIAPEILSILEEAKFSNHEMKMEQASQVMAYCETMKTQKREQLSRKEKFFARYIKGID